MRMLALCWLLAVPSCASGPPPIVDLVGKDPVKVNSDLAECHNNPYDHITVMPTQGFLPRGFPESRCLESMGYRVLSRTQ